ncbi:phage putative head morphogenesis protein, SPP1 gp7 family [Halopenitus malekzadehii]|uniref:Phage putative head morphogenesis protein, SPP1 gp7 family n=1 Tax=Halopenitus malekzadehii TaxID=1267564 RepID=A0A1H6JN26_9EURY|nr:phage minor head protein [Halopenitus malekzadehii]SEH60565.1 phage putative head morphogenesis protein, SPP1 gp7 family [Halopenitus malekzadehii]
MRTSQDDGRFADVVGPNTVTETTAQLSDWGARLAAGDHGDDHRHLPPHVEQLADEYARPTKDSGDPHANDPSRTTTIQRQYARKLRGRFADIRAELRRGVSDRDVLGLEDDDGGGVSLSDLLSGQAAADIPAEYYELLAAEQYDAARDLVEQLADFDPDDLQGRDFAFERDARKHEQFMQWLRTQQEEGVLEVIERNGNTYVRKAYERGVRNQHSWMGDAADGADPTAAFERPVHQDRLSLLYERNFEALRGITDDVAREISRSLAEGMAEGVAPDEMARRLSDRIDKIGRTRATTLARTETMYAHNEGAISEAERLAGDDVDLEVQTEVATAGDNHVCEICSPWDGRVLSPDEARSKGPPFHPRCRCVVRATTSVAEGTAAQTAPTAS